MRHFSQNVIGRYEYRINGLGELKTRIQAQTG